MMPELLIVVPLLTEALKAFNAMQAGKPADEVRVEALVFWNISKLFLKPFLTADQIKQLEAQGVNL